ncbi:unnamed protein product [Dibothriocephalus latus]|uniref:Uncharacterized protein n=1 Tax=Dibothriocephalus latus TaxID=60516 RepID=A0A3P7L9C8_DIBLA|nr:unnamed protein product [Dibothriocephalus latus]
MKLEDLQGEALQLKEAQKTLIWFATALKGKRKNLLKKVEKASNNLLSTCNNALSVAKDTLDQTATQCKKKVATVMNERKLLKLIAQQLLSLHLLVDKSSTRATTGVGNNMQCKHLHRSHMVSEPIANAKPLERWD